MGGGADRDYTPPVGRLDDIAARNKNPKWFKGQIAFGVRSVFLLVILGLLLFTNWALAPEDDRPGITVVPGPVAKDPAVRDVKLWTPPRARGSAAPQPERP